MSSTYSPNLRIELVGNGEQSGVWGSTTNTNLGTLIEQAISGTATVTTNVSPYALSAYSGASDESRCAVLRLNTTTGATFNVYVPPVSKLYVVVNVSSYACGIYVSTSLGNIIPAGAGYSLPANSTGFIYCNGTVCVDAANHLSGSLSIDDNLSVDGTITGIDVLGTSTLVPPKFATAFPSSTLSAAINSSASTITLTDASSFNATGGTAVVDSEKFTFASANSTQLLGCVRPSGVEHSINAVVTQYYISGVTSTPLFTDGTLNWNSASDQLVVGTGSSARVYVDTVTAQSLSNKTLLGGYVNGQYRGNTTAVSALAIDCSLGNYFTKSISTNSTFTVSNVPTQVYSMTVQLTTSSSAIPTWFANVYWPDNINPSTSISNGVHLFMFVTNDGGTTWHGAALTNYTA